MRRIVLFLLILATGVLSQNYNPPFPRTAFFSPSMPFGGAKDYIISRYDLVDHGLTLESARLFNEKIRANNPDIIIFGTSRQGVWANTDPSALFVYHAVAARTATTVAPGSTDIIINKVNSYAFPTRHKYALIGDTDWISYTSIDETGIHGIPASDSWGIDTNHIAGELIKFPNRMSGFGMLPNLSSMAKPINGEPAWKYFIDGRFSRQDFSIFDGIHYDAFRIILWEEDWETASGIDLDMNNVDDLEEHGYNWINQKWSEGITDMLEYEHQKFKSIIGDKLPLINTNTGAAEDGYALNVSDGMFWEGFMRFAYSWDEMLRINRLWEQKSDNTIMIIEDYDSEPRRAYSKNKFSYMRYGLTTALMSGAYYGRTFGDYYYIGLYYDEFDSDLGYPTSNPYKLNNGVYVRFFDKGLAMCNPVGDTLEVTNSQISSFSEYNGPYYRMHGGQDPLVNTGELFAKVSLLGTTPSTSLKAIKGDGILLFTAPVTVVSDIIIGNCLNNDTSPGSVPLTLAGQWQNIQDYNNTTFDTTRNPYYSQWGDNSEDGIAYAISTNPNVISTATFAPNINVPGKYEVAVWNGWHGTNQRSINEATDAKCTIVINGQTILTRNINQRDVFGKWNIIGTFELPTGIDSYIILSNASANGPIIADAVRFKFVQENLGAVPSSPTGLKILK